VVSADPLSLAVGKLDFVFPSNRAASWYFALSFDLTLTTFYFDFRVVIEHKSPLVRLLQEFILAGETVDDFGHGSPLLTPASIIIRITRTNCSGVI